jgi:hypothetical protein
MNLEEALLVETVSQLELERQVAHSITMDDLLTCAQFWDDVLLPCY